MKTSYEHFKEVGAQELIYEKLPDNYMWITGCGGDGWYWNFFVRYEDVGTTRKIFENDVIMCKISKL